MCRAVANLQLGFALILTLHVSPTCTAMGSYPHKVGSKWTSVAWMLGTHVRTLYTVLLDRWFLSCIGTHKLSCAGSPHFLFSTIQGHRHWEL